MTQRKWSNLIAEYEVRMAGLKPLLHQMEIQDPRDEEPYGLSFLIFNLERAANDVQRELDSMKKNTTP